MNQLGDLLFSYPALEALKRENPDMKTCSVINSNLAGFLKGSGYVDEIIEKDAYTKLRCAKILKENHFTKAVLFSESPSSLIAAYLSGASERIGFETASLHFLLTRKVPRIGVPSTNNNAKIAQVLGVKNVKPTYEGLVKVPDEATLKIKSWFEKNGINPAQTVAFSVGASKRRSEKCLAPKVWAEVLNALTLSKKVPVLVGAAFEEEYLRDISSICKSRPEIFISQNIFESAAFFNESALFCGIDSGAMHLAAAMGTKCVAVFVHTDPGQIGPQPLYKHVIIQQTNIHDVLAKDIILAVLDNL